MNSERMEVIDDLFIKRKVFVATVGWVGAIIAGLLIYFSLMGLINVLVFQSHPFFDTLPAQAPGVASGFYRTVTVICGAYAIGIAFGLFFLIAAVGLLKFKEFGRKVFVITSWLFIVVGILGVGLYVVYSGTILNQLIESGFPNSMIEGLSGFVKIFLAVKITSYGILLVVLLRALFRIALRLRKEEYKSHFY